MQQGFPMDLSLLSNLASFSSLKITSVGIFFGSPLLGFGPLPPTQVPIIYFHGVYDDSIPYAVEYSTGRGPQGEDHYVIGWDVLL